MINAPTKAKAAGALLAALALGVPAALATSSAVAKRHAQIKHVLLISVDGLHQSDLDWYIANHPGSELAKLVAGGAEFSNTHTVVPSDSDPGGTALMTGGDPAPPVFTTTSRTTTTCTRRAPRPAPARPGPMSSTTRRTTSTRPGSTPARASPDC